MWPGDNNNLMTGVCHPCPVPPRGPSHRASVRIVAMTPFRARASLPSPLPAGPSLADDSEDADETDAQSDKTELYKHRSRLRRPVRQLSLLRWGDRPDYTITIHHARHAHTPGSRDRYVRAISALPLLRVLAPSLIRSGTPGARDVLQALSRAQAS